MDNITDPKFGIPKPSKLYTEKFADTFHVKKDIISTGYKKYLEEMFLNENIWAYLPSVVQPELTADDQSFGCTIYFSGIIQPPETKLEPYNSAILGLTISMFDAFGITETIDVIRVRMGLFLPSRSKTFIVNTPHVDFDDSNLLTKNHITLLYYFNTTDAPTYLYNETSENIENTVEYGVKHQKDFTIKQIFECEENTAVCLDGKYYHSSSTTINSNYRLNMTFNGVLR